MSRFTFRPKLLDSLSGYSRSQFLHDVSAGLTVGVLALPLAMAFAIASGVSPSAGIWTAITAGFCISAFGGSRVQIGGPTGAFIPIIYAIVVDYGIANLMIATLLAGLMLIGMGLFRLGNLIRFIPVSVVIGFTNGIAVVIFLAQVKDFLGVKIDNLPGEFFGRIAVLAEHLHTLDLPTVALAVTTLVILACWPRWSVRISFLKKIPSPLFVLLAATIANYFLALPVETIGSRFGGIPQVVPEIQLPALSLETLGKLISPALTIALLGAIESLLSARVADGQIHDKHDPNQELIGQGIANLVAPLFGGFAATGAIARTATNIRSGGRSPIAGIIHAFVLLLVALLAAPFARHIPLAVLSAIVVMVAINMGEWHAFRDLIRYSGNYRIILISTFLMTVIFDLTLAVEIGMCLSCLFFIYRISDLTSINHVAVEDYDSAVLQVEKFTGSLFFGAVGKLEKLAEHYSSPPAVVIFDLDRVINMDTTGLDALQSFWRELKAKQSLLILCAVQEQPASLLRRSEFLPELGEENVCENLGAAIQRADQYLGLNQG